MPTVLLSVPRKTPKEWLSGQLDFISEQGSRVAAVRPQVSHAFGPHTAFRNSLSFVFIDPAGMDLEWSTMESLSEQFPCMDLLLNFSYGAERVLADLRGGRALHERVMGAFAGKDWFMLLADERQSVVNFVESKISNVLGKRVGDKVLMRDADQKPRYFLLLRVPSTRFGSPFFGAHAEMIDRVRGLGPRDVLGVLNDKFGRSILSFSDSANNEE